LANNLTIQFLTQRKAEKNKEYNRTLITLISMINLINQNLLNNSIPS